MLPSIKISSILIIFYCLRLLFLTFSWLNYLCEIVEHNADIRHLSLKVHIIHFDDSSQYRLIVLDIYQLYDRPRTLLSNKKKQNIKTVDKKN
jgi:hypothetical protein